MSVALSAFLIYCSRIILSRVYRIPTISFIVRYRDHSADFPFAPFHYLYRLSTGFKISRIARIRANYVVISLVLDRESFLSKSVSKQSREIFNATRSLDACRCIWNTICNVRAANAPNSFICQMRSFNLVSSLSDFPIHTRPLLLFSGLSCQDWLLKPLALSS